MGNSQSQTQNQNPSPSSSRRFGSPRPKGRAVYSTNNPSIQQVYSPPRPPTPKRNSHSPKRSSSLRSAASPRSPRTSGGQGQRIGRERELDRDRDQEKEPAVHPSLRTKKKSLELPDLASFTPIPLDPPVQALTPPHTGSNPGSPRFGNFEGGPYIVRSSIAFPVNLQNLLAPKPIPAFPPTSILASPTCPSQTQVPEPLAMAVNPRPSEGDAMYLVKISWHGGGQEVFLTRAGDDDWNGRRKMELEETTATAEAAVLPEGTTTETLISPVPEGTSASTTFSTIISLPRGTHHLRFLVDGQHRVADDLPTAVDDNGSLANYVAVGLGIADADPIPSGTVVAGSETAESQSGSGLTEASEATGSSSDTVDVQPEVPAIPVQETEEITPINRQESFWSADEHDGYNESHPPSPFIPMSTLHDADTTGMDNLTSNSNATPKSTTPKQKTKSKVKAPYVPQWTQEIPLELLEAAVEEETYLAHQNELENAHISGRRIHITGFIPLPNIPPAPKLPRYLEKVILNSNTVPRPGAASPGGRASRGGSPGIGGFAQQHGGGNIAGIGANGVLGERTTRERGYSPSRAGDIREGRRRDRERRSMSMSGAEGQGQGDPDRKERERERERERPLPITTASGTDVSSPRPSPMSPLSSPNPNVRPTSPLNPNTVPQSPGYPHPQSQGQDLVIADDTSVLPVPSHVVLGHLGTSAIRDGVLAVGDTVRYRQKFFTTIYYKPTS